MRIQNPWRQTQLLTK